ncbi:MAG: hypothetical protein ACRD9R_12120 [Pyrinomonadaceae bacterium]
MILTARCLLFLCLAFSASPPSPAATIMHGPGRVVCRPEMGADKRENVAERLREITGWTHLRFDADGALRGSAGAQTNERAGSRTARALLEEAAGGDNLVVLEDASGRDDVVFCRVVPGRWTGGGDGRPPAHIVLIDFADFSHVRGDSAALSAFNVGWAVLHEIAHVVHNAADAVAEAETGECESLINQMRRELQLAERAEYHFKLFPGADSGDFKTRYVRLAFERRHPARKEKKRYWLVWDAQLVGGLSAAGRR